MDRLWSPWRSQYIDSFKNKGEKIEGCVFCHAVNEDINDVNCLKIYDGNKAFMILNLYPYNNGHIMVLPKRHLSDMNDLTDEETSEMMKLTKVGLKAIEKVLAPHGCNFGANLGKEAGAGIDTHLHFHIVPRWNGDTNFMPVIGEIKVISQDLSVTKQRLREAIAELIK